MTDISAIISTDGIYRYRLTRLLPGNGTVVFVMLNPSTADASLDDPTIRKCRGFANRWGFGRVEVVNLFAYRATKPTDLSRARSMGVNVVGPENGFHIEEILAGESQVDRIIAAWGANADRWGWAKWQAGQLMRKYSGHRFMRIGGLTNGGSPKHPLMLPYDSPLEEHRR